MVRGFPVGNGEDDDGSCDAARPDRNRGRMKLPRAAVWAAPVVAVACATSACGGGTSSADGIKQAKKVRISAAQTYWKARTALPASLHLDEPYGKGRFVTCTTTEKNGKGAVKYDLFDYLVPVKAKLTMAQLLSGVESGLKPQGWTFTPYTIPRSAMPDPENEELHGWRAHKGDQTINLTLHEARSGASAAGNFDVLTDCKKYGGAQKKLLADYAGGDSRDDYRPTSTADPTPIPTGFPTSM